MEHLDTQPNANFAQGSFWNAFNTVTYMTDHIQGRSNDGRMTSSWYGRNRRVKQHLTGSGICRFCLKVLCGG